jgi:hypothetical protein
MSILAAGLAVVSLPANLAAQVTLSWDASPGAIANYILCWGTNSGQYYATNAYPSTQVTGTVSNLVYGEVFYFAVAAVASDGSQSPFSNEAIYTNEPASTNGLAGSPPVPPGGTTNQPGTGGSSNSVSGSSPTNFAQAQIWGVPPMVTLSLSSNQPMLTIGGTVGASVSIQASSDPTSPDLWTTLTNISLTNLASVITNTSGLPPDMLDLAFVPASQVFSLPQTNAPTQYFRVVMPYDYPILASMVLPAQGYTPRLVLVNMPGIVVDDCCYVNEAGSFIHYSPSTCVLQLEGSGSTIRQIAINMAGSLSLDWTTASEFTFTNGMGQILATVVETEPASSDPIATPASNAPIVINF